MRSRPRCRCIAAGRGGGSPSPAPRSVVLPAAGPGRGTAPRAAARSRCPATRRGGGAPPTRRPGSSARARGGGRARPRPRRARGSGGAWLVPAPARARSRPRCAPAACSTTPSRTGSARRAQAPAPTRSRRSPRWRDFVVGDPVPPAVDPDQPADRARRHPDRRRPSRDRRLQHDDAGGAGVGRLPRHRHDHRGRRAANGVGIVGIWPGARALEPAAARRQDHLRGLRARSGARSRGAAVINMSYGVAAKCIAEEQQILRAVRPARCRSPRRATSSATATRWSSRPASRT